MNEYCSSIWPIKPYATIYLLYWNATVLFAVEPIFRSRYNYYEHFLI